MAAAAPADGDSTQTIKVVLVGDGASGKTSIIRRYCHEDFGAAYAQTVGLDFFMKRLALPGEKNVTLQIWDIGGQSIGGKMLKTYLEDADAIALTYDMTNRDSFENLQDWLDLARKQKRPEGKAPPTMALIANKRDLLHLRAVTAEQHETFAKQNGLLQLEVCAKDGVNIDMAFRKIVAAVTEIPISHKEAETMRQRAVVADIVDHPVADPSKKVQVHPDAKGRAARSSFCVVQ